MRFIQFMSPMFARKVAKAAKLKQYIFCVLMVLAWKCIFVQLRIFEDQKLTL